MSNILRPVGEFRKAIALSAVLATTLGLTACSSDSGYGSSIELCQSGDDTGVEATVDSHDENDPTVILRFAEDSTQGYADESAESRWDTDLLASLGEITCSTAEKQVDPDKLVFTPSGLQAREDYISNSGKQNQ